jgi:hypothetical protein
MCGNSGQEFIERQLNYARKALGVRQWDEENLVTRKKVEEDYRHMEGQGTVF